MRARILSFIQSSLHSCKSSLICSSNHSSTHPPSCTHSFTHSYIHSLMHAAFILSIIHLFMYRLFFSVLFHTHSSFPLWRTHSKFTVFWGCEGRAIYYPKGIVANFQNTSIYAIAWMADKGGNAWLIFGWHIRRVTHYEGWLTSIPFCWRYIAASDLSGRKANTNATQSNIPWNPSTAFLMCTSICSKQIFIVSTFRNTLANAGNPSGNVYAEHRCQCSHHGAHLNRRCTGT